MVMWKENKIKDLSNGDCEFSYRNSIFKKEKGRYIILYVVYRLSKDEPKDLYYPDVVKYFKDKNITKPNLKEVREAIVLIRNNKLPDFRILPNVGSFFKNPIVSNDIANKVKTKFSDAKIFKVDEENMKIPAGWLIENAGLKGKSFENISVYDKNALVLVNNDNATKEDLFKARDEIIKTVQDKFGVVLEQEPENL
jgi:UDP-N-acetylmuramate dehydrogenase